MTLRSGRRLPRLFLVACAATLLLAALAVGAAQTEEPAAFAFEGILERSTPRTADGFLRDVEIGYADPAGGQMVVFLGRPNSDCTEQYLITWTFSEDVQVVRPNQTFGVEYSVVSEGGDCGGVHEPVVEFVGTPATDLTRGYAERCDATLGIVGRGSDTARRAVVGRAGRIDFAADGAVRRTAGSGAACGYAHLGVVVRSRGTEYELVYLYLNR